MNHFAPTKPIEIGNFLVAPKLIAAMVVFVSTFLFIGPLSASATPVVWTDSEAAAVLNAGNNASVNSVSCTSNTSCVAGGQYLDGIGSYQAFVSVYNGRTWADHEVAGSLNVGNGAQVNSVSCVSSTSCVAGGKYADGIGSYQAFVSVYNGRTWADHEVAGSLNVGNGAQVNSVSCVSSTSCVAGGQYIDAGLNVQAFVSVYNGNTWVDHEVAGSLNFRIAFVNSVTCFSNTSCVAGGQYIDAGLNAQAFVSVYNGNTWVDHEVAGLLNLGGYANVYSLSCGSSTSCVAGGLYVDGSSQRQAFVSVYNGSTWADHEVAGSSNVGNFATVYSVSCTSSGLCVAGGQYKVGSTSFQALLSSTTLPVAHARVSGTVYFASGSSALNGTAKNTLNTIAAQIVSQNQSSVTLNGYTDPLGSASYNLRLSLQRANSVKSYLRSKLASLGDTHVIFVVHGRGVTRSGSSFARDRKVTIS
jgi:hypothetical protein